MKMLHVFTEEASAKNVFEIVLPKILPPNVFFRVYPHQGKQDLENALKKTIPSISNIPNSLILITRDKDNIDCKELKNEIIAILNNRCNCPYKIRIVCHELESWFLGDLGAVQMAYPRFKKEHHANKADIKNVDGIQKPSLYLLKIIPEYSGLESLPKLETSESISPFIDLQKNTSVSFQNMLSGVLELISDELRGTQITEKD